MSRCLRLSFFFNDTATTEIYTLSLHDALPILSARIAEPERRAEHADPELLGHLLARALAPVLAQRVRSEEHTSELQSQSNLVCRLLLEKKKKRKTNTLEHERQLLHSAAVYDSH